MFSRTRGHRNKKAGDCRKKRQSNAAAYRGQEAGPSRMRNAELLTRTKHHGSIDGTGMEREKKRHWATRSFWWPLVSSIREDDDQRCSEMGCVCVRVRVCKEANLGERSEQRQRQGSIEAAVWVQEDHNSSRTRRQGQASHKAAETVISDRLGPIQCGHAQAARHGADMEPTRRRQLVSGDHVKC